MADVPSQRRLQREDDFTGERLTAFRQVFLRHGLPGVALGVVFLVYPGTASLLSAHVSSVNTELYLACGIGLAVGLSLYAAIIDRGWRPVQLGWVVYLGLLSLWEEWVFRLALPHFLEGFGVDLFHAVIVSNVLFGAMHYFTLRWKWPWCLGALLGGLALSKQLELHQDLLLIAAYHWIGTFLNTPRSPGSRRWPSEH